MNYNEDDIFNRILKDIDIDPDEFNCDTIEDYIWSRIPSDCSYNYGATKLVIIPNDADYVIKIPFATQGEREDNGYWDENDNYIEEEGKYIPLCGACYPLSEERGWDYCRTETEYYALATEEGLNKFFAKTEYIGDYNGYPIYVQEKCTMYGDSPDLFTPEEREKASRRSSTLRNGERVRSFGDDFMTSLFQFATEEEIDSLFDFIDKYGIWDLHSSWNYGFLNKNNHAVFVDYASYDN